MAGYVERQEYSEALAELVSLFEPGTPQGHLADRVRRILVHEPNKLCRVVFKSRATDTPKGGSRLEPSDLMLRLISAVRANADDEITVIEHELSLPSAVGA